MIVEIKEKGIIMMPKEMINRAHLHKGDRLDMTYEQGNIVLRQVDVSPKGYVKSLEKQIEELTKKLERATK